LGEEHWSEADIDAAFRAGYRCGDLVTILQSRTASLFGRLIYVASLQHPDAGLYEARLLVRAYGQEEVDRVLAQEHEAIFEDWLCLPLEQQKSEVGSYLAGHCEDQRDTLQQWIRQRYYERLIPRRAIEAERQLFIADLEMILPLLYMQA
jgi:hypothetical protein